MSGEPRKIGRYEVKRLLGHGAMGQVYLAFDPLLKRLLAIKTVRESDSDLDSTLVRFQREAEISARLNHPNIVTVHDVGRDPEVGPFMAMEFIDGLPLSELIHQGIPTESVIHLLLQGMSALQAAEGAGITHRDVKPANILVAHDGRLKLMDFGIARNDDTRLTLAGQIIGTPSYTAPEALGGTEPSSVSDRYAFAVTAFQMLTRELPFECPTIAATLFRIAHEPPLFPDSMSPAVRAVFEQALAKDPADRYPDLASFMKDLIAAVDLPAATKAKLLGGLAGDAGAVVAHLVKARAEETASFNRELQTQSSPMPYRAGTATIETATELFRTPMPGTLVPHGRVGRPSLATQDMEPPRPAPPARRRSWPRWTAAGVAAAAVLGFGAWQLRPHSFRVDVSSSPAGASVFLNHRPIGQTDLRAEIPPEGGTLRLELAGYEPQECRIRPGDGALRVVLARPTYAVQVVTQPPGAEAFLNGVAQGTTPIRGLQVPVEGRQELVLRLGDHQDWTRVLDRDISLPEIIRLVPLTVAARSRTRPPSAAAAVEKAGAAPAVAKVEPPPVRKVEAVPARQVEPVVPAAQPRVQPAATKADLGEDRSGR